MPPHAISGVYLLQVTQKTYKFEDKHTQNMPQSSNLYSNLGSNLAERIRQKELIMQKT
jgi:predicted 2-oxoglutarate/Fe(II)-dependent dioxygenase YbiX